MQKNREILADRLIPQRHHLLGRGADDNVIAVSYRQAQQVVTHCAADDIGFHDGLAASQRKIAARARS